MKYHTIHCYDIFSFHLIQFSLEPLNKLQVNKEEIPPQFEAATNQLQICNWLVAYPNILKLANYMLATSVTSISSTSLTSTSLTSPSSVSDNVSTKDIF